MDDQHKLTLFMGLSQTLTGFEHLSDGIGRDYLERLLDGFGEQAMAALLTRYDTVIAGDEDITDAVKTAIMEDQEHSPLAKELIMLWYTAQYKDLTGSLQQGTAAHYYNSLIWKAIQAHPPGVSGGIYGYWAEAPEMPQ